MGKMLRGVRTDSGARLSKFSLQRRPKFSEGMRKESHPMKQKSFDTYSVPCVADCMVDCVRDFGVPQPTEWQRIGGQIKAAFVVARAYFVNVHSVSFQNASDREHKTRLRESVQNRS
jgi:hypothetical protein